MAVGFGACASLSAQSYLFWAQSGTDVVQRAELTGANPTAVTPTLNSPWGVDVSGTTVYFTEDNIDKVWRMDLDGSNRTQITAAIDLPRDIMEANGQLYVVGSFTSLYRMNLDGSGLTTLFSGGNFLQSIHVTDTHIYITDSNGDKIRRSDLNGGNLTDLVTTGLNLAYGIFATDDYLYWTDIGDDTIKRSNLDGTGAVTLITSVVNPTGLFITDTDLFFTQQRESANGGVYRADLDGSNVVGLVTGIQDARFIDGYLSAIPEPASYAALTATLVLGFAAGRRRRVR